MASTEIRDGVSEGAILASFGFAPRSPYIMRYAPSAYAGGAPDLRCPDGPCAPRPAAARSWPCALLPSCLSGAWLSPGSEVVA